MIFGEKMFPILAQGPPFNTGTNIFVIDPEMYAEMVDIWGHIYLAEWWIIGLLSLSIGIALCRIVTLRSPI